MLEQLDLFQGFGTYHLAASLVPLANLDAAAEAASCCETTGELVAHSCHNKFADHFTVISILQRLDSPQIPILQIFCGELLLEPLEDLNKLAFASRPHHWWEEFHLPSI